MTKRFSRCVESFVCANCGTQVDGNGYTNHCPNCLYSKHVDNNPGDREATCCGIMEPISVENRNKDFTIIFRCKKCGCIKKNKTSIHDSTDEIIELSKKYI